MTFCAWDYCSGPIFCCQSQCDLKPLPILSLKQLFTGKETLFNIIRLHLVRNPFSLLLNHSQCLCGISKWLVESLLMILTIFLDFDTSLKQVMPPIQNPRIFSVFHPPCQSSTSKSPLLKR